MVSKKANLSNPLSVSELELVGKKKPHLTGKGRGLRPAAWKAFSEMAAAAQKDGIRIVIESSYRDYDSQKRIWNRKFRLFSRTEKNAAQVVHDIVHYSAIPGTSRHHWGTDLDLIDGSHPAPADSLESTHFAPDGIYHNLYVWLQTHAKTFGFYEVYTQNPHRTGFAYEPWHWSFAQLSIPMLEQFCSLPLSKYLNDPNLKGYKVFTSDFIKNYVDKWVMGINPDLIPRTNY